MADMKLWAKELKGRGKISRRTTLSAIGAPIILLPFFTKDGLSHLTPEQFGAKGDGRTSDAMAINRALARLVEAGGGELRFSSGTYLIDMPLDGRKLSNVTLRGNGMIKAVNGSRFEYILDIAGTRNVTIDGLTFDANKAGRLAAAKLSCVNANATAECIMTNCTFLNALGRKGSVGTSSVAVSASNGCKNLLVYGCVVKDCGISATIRPSDGIFVRGNDCIIRNCRGENITDHAFVLEGCSGSKIENCSGYGCTSIAAISNDMNEDIEGNEIAGIEGSSSYLGSFGGIVGVYALGRGRIRKSFVRDINVTVASNAKGSGAGLYLYGAMDGVIVEKASVDAGTSKGVMTHAAVLDRVSGVELRDSRLRADPAGTCIRLVNRAAGARIVNNSLVNGLYGIYADGASAFIEGNNHFVDCRTPMELAGQAVVRRVR